MKIGRLYLLLIVLVVLLCMIPLRSSLRYSIGRASQMVMGKQSVAGRIEQFGPAVRGRLAPEFERIGVRYPSQEMLLVALKEERLLEVWVGAPLQHLKTYPILGASGTLGPKLREGDRQVPEGLYRIESLNPNSLYHLSLRVNYPNRFDKAKGQADGRGALGCDIMIHGRRCSIGCLAMGDEAAEELFVLAAEIDIKRVSLIISPVDFRKRELPVALSDLPAWTPELYASIKQALEHLEKGKSLRVK